MCRFDGNFVKDNFYVMMILDNPYSCTLWWWFPKDRHYISFCEHFSIGLNDLSWRFVQASWKFGA